jgi:hypothetical protein
LFGAKYLPKIPEVWSVDYEMLLSKIYYHIHALMSTQTQVILFVITSLSTLDKKIARAIPLTVVLLC